MPTTLEQLSLGQQVALEQADPELHALLSGAAPAELELAAIQGTLAPAPTSPQERQQQANAARVAELLATQPAGRPGRYEGEDYIPPIAPNITNLMLLQSLDDTAYQREKLQAIPPQQGTGLSAEDVAFVQAEMHRARMESAEIAYSGGDF